MLITETHFSRVPKRKWVRNPKLTFFFLNLYMVCFSVLFLFICFRDYLNTRSFILQNDIKMHFSLACCLYGASI